MGTLSYRFMSNRKMSKLAFFAKRISTLQAYNCEC